MATASYLEDTAGGMVAGAAFDDDGSARQAVELLAGSGVRPQDISVIARDPRRADRIAGDQAWTPGRSWSGPLGRLMKLLPGGGLPKDVRRRYGAALSGGRVIVVAAAGGQPADTLAALLAQAKGADVLQWWQPPAPLFAPPERAGPF